MKIRTADHDFTLMLSVALLWLGLLLILSPNSVQARSLSVSPQTAARKEISRKRAIEIARKQVTFQPKSTEAIKTNADQRAVWRVTFRGAAISAARPMGEVTIVEVDRESGKIVSISKS